MTSRFPWVKGWSEWFQEKANRPWFRASVACRLVLSFQQDEWWIQAELHDWQSQCSPLASIQDSNQVENQQSIPISSPNHAAIDTMIHHNRMSSNQNLIYWIDLRLPFPNMWPSTILPDQAKFHFIPMLLVLPFVSKSCGNRMKRWFVHWRNAVGQRKIDEWRRSKARIEVGMERLLVRKCIYKPMRVFLQWRRFALYLLWYVSWLLYLNRSHRFRASPVEGLVSSKYGNQMP